MRRLLCRVLRAALNRLEPQSERDAEDWKRTGELWAMVANAKPFRPQAL